MAETADGLTVTLLGRQTSRLAGAVRTALPEGRMPDQDVWDRRHRMIIRVAGLQAAAMILPALSLGDRVEVAYVGGPLIVLPLILAFPEHLSRKVRSRATTVSLFMASVVPVQVTPGLTEAHFHFFVMVGVVALYQDWVPFLVGLLIVVLTTGWPTARCSAGR